MEYVQDSTKGIVHAQKDGEVLCGMSTDEIILEDAEDVTCQSCKAAHASERDRAIGCKSYNKIFSSEQVQEAEEFIESMNSSLQDMILEDYNKETLVCFAFLESTEYSILDIQMKTSASARALLEIHTTYTELFAWD